MASSPNYTLHESAGSSKPAIGFGKNGGVSVSGAPKLDADKPFTISAIFQTKDDKSYTIATHINARDKSRGWVLDMDEGLPAFHLTGDNGGKIEIRAERSEHVKAGQWNHVMVVYDGTREQYGLELYINGHLAATQGRAAMTKISGPVSVDDPIRLGTSLDGGAIADLRIYDRALTPEDAELLRQWPAIAEGLGKPTDAPPPSQRAALAEYFAAREFAPFRRLADEQAKLSLDANRDCPPRRHHPGHAGTRRSETQCSRALSRRLRSARDAGGSRTRPPCCRPWPPSCRATGWASRSGSSLTISRSRARVAVNRMWQEIFGTGMVKTADDFGSQGEPPSHPELLDWLAVDFRENGWDVKRFYRQMLTVGRLPAGGHGDAGEDSKRIRRTDCSAAVRGSAWMARWCAITRWPRAAC